MDGGISITFDLGELDAAITRLGPILDFDGRELMDIVGAVGESQTRRRITDEKTSPEGTPWPDNRAKTPTLHQTGRNLLDSVAFVADDESAEWGAGWEYAHVHQNGMVILPKTAEKLVFKGANGTVFADKVTIPARPFIGISSANHAELFSVITDFFSSLASDGAQ